MIRSTFRMALLGATIWLTTPDAARAEPAPSADNRQIAKQYVDAGLAAEEIKDYDTAITMYRKAYELVPHPVLIYDMAQACRKAGRLDEALREYRRYLSVEPSGPRAEIVRGFIAELEAKRAAADPEGARPARPPGDGNATSGERGGATTDASTHRSELGATRASEVSDTQGNGPRSAGPAIPRDAAPGRMLRVAGLATGGAGIAALAVAVGFGVHARSLDDKLSVPGGQYDQGDFDDGRLANRIAIAGYVIGGVLVVTGAVLYWRGLSRDRVPETAVLAPMISERSMGLALVGRWP